MVLEVAILDVIDGEEEKFEKDFFEAEKIIASMKGYHTNQLQKCIEKNNRYILMVNWNTLEDHTVGFRLSDEYQRWKMLLHHYYDPFPVVEHYEEIVRE